MGREGWKKKKGRGGGLTRPEQESHEALGLGMGKLLGDSGTLLGHPLTDQCLPSIRDCGSG